MRYRIQPALAALAHGQSTSQQVGAQCLRPLTACALLADTHLKNRFRFRKVLVKKQAQALLEAFQVNAVF